MTPYKNRLNHLPPLLLFAALALGAQYPLWLAPAQRLEDPGDPVLNSWILSWDHYALFHQLFDFFQANVFWPHADSLAYGEHILAPAVLALPLRLFTAAPAAIHTFSQIQGYFLCAAAAYLLGLFYFRRVLPATIAGLAYGFAGYRLNQGGHVQLIHGEFLPLMILAFERLRAGGGRGWRWLLGISALGQWLTSWYWAVFSFWVFVPYAAVRLWPGRRALGARRLAALALPLVIAAACALPVAWPYLRLKRQNYLIRPPESAVSFTARPADYLEPTAKNLLYGRLASGAGGAERTLFPGIFVTLGFCAAFLDALRRRKKSMDYAPVPDGEKIDFPARLWVGLVLLLLSFTFGTHALWHGRSIPLPLALLRWFPLADQMRAPGRWMLPATLGLALLAADSWRRLRAAGFRAARPLAMVSFALLAAESLTWPIQYYKLPPVDDAAMGWFERGREAPVFVLPPQHPAALLMAARLPGWPFFNGTNGYFPPAHLPVMNEITQGFPGMQARERLRGLGVRYVAVDLKAAREASPGWDPARLGAMLTEVPPGLATARAGSFVIIDLGTAEQDLKRIGANYDKLENELLEASRKAAK